MKEYIEREKAQDGLDNIDWYHVNDKGQLLPGGKSDIETYVPFKAVEEMLKSIPAADVVEVRHGRWIPGKEVAREYYGDCPVRIFYDKWTCSECGYVIDDHKYSAINYKFCPNCRADMREKINV